MSVFAEVFRRASSKNDKEHHRARDICTDTGNQEGIMGRGVLDGWILYSDDQREREQGSHREVHKESGKREGYKATTVI